MLTWNSSDNLEIWWDQPTRWRVILQIQNDQRPQKSTVVGWDIHHPTIPSGALVRLKNHASLGMYVTCAYHVSFPKIIDIQIPLENPPDIHRMYDVCYDTQFLTWTKSWLQKRPPWKGVIFLGKSPLNKQHVCQTPAKQHQDGGWWTKPCSWKKGANGKSKLDHLLQGIRIENPNVCLYLSYHIISYHITSYLIVSYHIISYLSIYLAS